MDYRFPGIRAFSDPAVASWSVRPDFANKVHGEWFVARATDALTQLGDAPPEHRAAVLQQAVDAMDALKACLATVEGAVSDARRSLFPPGPAGPEPVPEPEPPTPEAAPERQRRRDR